MIEVSGLELRGHHGATEDERERGQRFLFDLELVARDDGARTDDLERTADYREAVAVVRDVSDGRRFALLEALAAAIADELLERLPALDRARVRVRKPGVRLGAPVEHAAATVERSRG